MLAAALANLREAVKQSPVEAISAPSATDLDAARDASFGAFERRTPSQDSCPLSHADIRESEQAERIGDELLLLAIDRIGRSVRQNVPKTAH